MKVVVDGRLRLALTALWLAGAGLAAVTAVVAVRRGVSGAAAYVGVAVVLALGAIFTARGHRLVTAIALVACAGQPLAVAATAWELTHRISRTQAEKLQALGVSPRVGVAINLGFSLCATVIAVWAFWTRRRSSAG